VIRPLCRCKSARSVALDQRGENGIASEEHAPGAGVIS
jgi:hypothetical protein